MDIEKMERLIEHNKKIQNERKNNGWINNIGPINSASEKTKQHLIIHSMRGLGDSINQRAFIKALNFHIFLDTPWPELYSDLPNVSFIKCATTLRTQCKNITRHNDNLFVSPPTTDKNEMNIMYGTRDLQDGGSMYKKMAFQFGVKPKIFDLPIYPMPEKIAKLLPDKPIAILRPATLRREWMASARNPDPKYIYEISNILIENGFFVISICDLEKDLEWIVGEEPNAHLKFHKGELNIEELLGLVENADVLVGGHGWLTHAAVSGKKQMLVIAGGYGGDNSPEQVADSSFTDTSMLTWILPDHYCKCSVMSHQCNKEISNFREKALAWIHKLV